MKYINFKRYKFSTIFKNINFRRYNFSEIFKYVDFRRLDFKKVYKYLYFIRIDLKKVYKYFNIRRFDFTKFSKYLNPNTYDISSIKNIDFISSKFLLIHLPASIVFFGFLYLFIPTFYNYDKSSIENLICKNKNIKCVVRGEVNYNFFPTPRIKIKDLVINGFAGKKNTLLTAEYAAVKLSFKNLLTKDKHEFKKINLNNYEVNFDLANLKKYKNIYTKKNNFLPINFVKGKIIFFNENNYVATINDVNLNLILEEYSKEAVLKGKFLNDDIYISLDSKKINGKPSTDIILKMSGLNFLTKANFYNYEKDKDAIHGNILIRKDKYRFTGFFGYKDNEITISKSNLKNIFLDGKLEGKIKLLPFFNFDLDLSLNSLNFTKLYNNFLALDEKDQKKLFKINKKINGKLTLSSEKIYSSYNLVKSFESRIKFNNGNILVEQCLFNLGKLGAADVSGAINNDKKFSNFKYESNIFVDNKKKFLSKFAIYNKKEIFPNLFVSGNFDLQNIKSTIYEISDKEKLSKDDVDFIEKEFNNLMLSDGYKNLFHFPKFKEFVKIITSE